MGSYICKKSKSEIGRERQSEPGRKGGSYLWHSTVGFVVKFYPLSFQIFLKWLLKRRTYTRNSTDGKFIPDNKTKQRRKKKTKTKKFYFFFKLTTSPNQNKVQAEAQLSRELEATRATRNPRNKTHFISPSDTSGAMRSSQILQKRLKRKIFQRQRALGSEEEPGAIPGSSSSSGPNE